VQSPAGLGAALAKIVSRTRPGGGASGPRCLRGRVVEAEDGLNSAPLRPSGALQDPKGGRCLKYRPPPGCLQPVRFVFCCPDGEHHNPQPSRASSSSVVRAAGGRGPAVDRWLTRSSDLLTSSSTTVASCGMSASGRVCGGAASARASGESSTVVYNFVAASGDPSPACACSSCRQVHHASSAAYQKSTAFPQLCLVPVSSVLFTAAGSSISLAY